MRQVVGAAAWFFPYEYFKVGCLFQVVGCTSSLTVPWLVALWRWLAICVCLWRSCVLDLLDNHLSHRCSQGMLDQP
jgi:hypothetical protein